MYLGLLRLSVGIATVVCARAQIESVTIKPVTAPDPCQALQRGVRLVDVIEQAYGLDVEIGSGPPWIWTQALDIHSNQRPETPADHVSLMMQQLLAERFHLKVHTLTGEREVDWLVVARGGLKMRRSRRSGCSLAVMPKPGVGVRVAAAGYTMASIAASLSLRLKTNVIDKTAIDGAFDFEVEYLPLKSERQWDLQVGPFVGLNLRESMSALPPYPPIRVALEEQLGLRLERHVTSTDILVVDRADPPAASRR